VARVLKKSNKGVGLLSAADPALGRAATALLAALERTQPDHQHHHLVHGSFYARHVLDLGDGPGVIDWDAFGHGSIEFDAGMFLATLSRHRLRNEPSAGAAAQAEEAFLAATSGLLDSRALAWYWAAALLHLAWRLLKRQAPAESHPLLRGAARLAEIAEATSRRYPLEEMMHVVRG
jgi:Ser/Thr protein kinase RdoA (MazF antagonist)